MIIDSSKRQERSRVAIIIHKVLWVWRVWRQSKSPVQSPMMHRGGNEVSGKRGKFVFNQDFIYKMPAHFGGDPFYPVRVVYGDNTVIYVNYETDEEALLNYIPEDFELKEPVVSVQYTNCRDVDWMIGGEYRLIQVTVPVKYSRSPEGLEGVYALVVWENKTCPIIGGREEDGVPKVYADISSERHLENHWFVAASYEQFTFLKIDLQRGDEVNEGDLAELNKNPKINLFGWRYLPNLGKGGATLSHATLYPQEAVFKQMWNGTGTVEWIGLTYEQHPLQSRIIRSLEALPIKKVTSAAMAKGIIKLNVGDSRILP